MLPGVSSNKRREPANGCSDLRDISRTRMKLWRDLNLTSVFTRSIGIPSSVWVCLDWGLNVVGFFVFFV